ncbi:unnamed protein product [Phyllotreta striolata]|uniref:Uncharacterized protein n=1 Tax=Phyllotreta striolata TaxID=444603 RepID=A0A9N9XUV1_PHYSR|nr:unnamed protein product [Phyllotreta striolata]
MSINVHVNGNPISIKRGKMVTSDFDQCKKEFEQRRLMRLEQVRQQSKDIAEGLRNKVKKEKKMQKKEIEEEGKQKLKNWQTRKLLELQNQYQDALKELGVGHKAAQTIGDETQFLAEQEQINQKTAAKRNKVASGKLCEDKVREEVEKARLIERKKLAREMESAQARLIQSPKPKRPRVKEKSHKSEDNINVTLYEPEEEEEEEESVENESNSTVTEETGEVDESSTCSCFAGDSRTSLDYIAEGSRSEENPPPIVPPLQLPREESPLSFPINASREPRAYQKCNPTFDTRISDRIKHRTGFYNNKSPNPTQIPEVETRSNARDLNQSKTKRNDCTCCCKRRSKSPRKRILKQDKQVATDFKENHGTQTSEIFLPSHPSVVIRDQPSKSSLQDSALLGSKVKVYDHKNRFVSEKSLPSGSMVEKIPPESLELLIDPVSEDDRQELHRKRERDAQIRGKKALEKERLQKEYEEMLKKLPLLQKKERICEIRNDKPEYHMSEERLKERERAKQNHLEKVYNNLFPNIKPATVTLPKVNQPRKENSIESVSETSIRSLNVAEWDVDKPPHQFSSQEVQDIINAFTRINPKDRRAKLKDLLKTLNIKKEELLQAIVSLPKTDSLDELINDLNSLDDYEVRGKSKSHKSPRKRSRRENTADTSFESSQEAPNSVKEESAGRVNGKSPRKKAKTKRRPNVIILQNTSTQTTPKPSKPATEETKAADSSKEKICDKLHVPCDCNKENQNSTDDMCHIFIKLNDDDVPEVHVKSKDKERASKPASVRYSTVGTQISPEKQTKDVRTHKKLTEPMKSHRYKSRAPDQRSNTTSRTWRDELSKNSISTTSTSYMSPPDFQNTKKPNLRSKPHQETLSSAYSSYSRQEQSTDPIKSYVKHLLSMSKGAVDNLSISTSNVDTPSQSIIEMESNVPKYDLKQLVETFKGKIEEIETRLKHPTAINASSFNTTGSTVDSCNDQTCRPTAPVAINDELVNKYAEISDSVAKRIEALTKMIENLRHEKTKILRDTKTADFSTAYMDLPEPKSSSSTTSSSKSSSLDDEDVGRRLVEIDQSDLDRLEQLRGNSNECDGPSNRGARHLNETNEEILSRLQRLKEHEQPSTSKEEQSFVPILSDIPRLPKFEPQNEANATHRRPPPSKGLAAAKKFNGNISLNPHELSTIVEADSQLSTKLPSPETSGNNLNAPLLTIPEIDLDSASGMASCRDKSKSSSGKDYKSGKDYSTSNKDDSMKSCEEFPSSILLPSSSSSSGKKKTRDDSTCGAISFQQSSSSSDDVESIEAMLRSIGMEWAIPTLYKTQEALALGSSSSSSLELSKKKGEAGSDISLNEYLKKKILKLPASTLISETTPPSFIGDQTELSGIPASSGEHSRQRTSTPINIDNSKTGFTDSDLSSIKHDKSNSKN